MSVLSHSVIFIFGIVLGVVISTLFYSYLYSEFLSSLFKIGKQVGGGYRKIKNTWFYIQVSDDVVDLPTIGWTTTSYQARSNDVTPMP